MFKLYSEAKMYAQSKADELGFDHGVEQNKLFKSWTVFMLPAKRFRCGHELRCEVVSAMNIERQRPGHGSR